MQSVFLSLLYPDEESLLLHSDRDNLPDISAQVCEELGLCEIFDLDGDSLAGFFTSDIRVIKYRQSVMKDLLSCQGLIDTLSLAHPVLNDIRELRRLDNESAASAESYLYSITEIELYVSCLDALKEGFAKVQGEFTSDAFLRLSRFVNEMTSSEYYSRLNEKLKALADRVNEVKSITVGVNLDNELRPESAGVISINSEKFKSGKLLDKILRMSFKNDAFTTIAPLTPFSRGQSENKQQALIGAFNSAIEEVFRSSVKGWRSVVSDYVMENTDFLLKLLPEIEFLAKSAALIRELLQKEGCGVVYPEVAPMSEKRFSAKGLYNPRVALAIEERIVDNDIAFDTNAGLYVLTGPNRGGKSVVTVALGAAQAMCQLGLPVAAKEALISPVSGIFTHFPEGADDTIDKGRLGEECQRLKEIFDAVDSDGMILLDESLSSTGAYEASYLASEVLASFAALGVRGIFSTHLHELAASVGEINERSEKIGGIKIDTLVAGIEDGARSFKIYRMKPDGKSYARDIADKYGLSFENLTQKIRKG